MSRCKQCNVEILDETERCPLCHSVLEKTVEVENMYPNVRTMTRRLALLSRIYLFVAILVEALLIYLNVLSDSEMFWSAIPGLAMLYGYLVLRYAILGKSGYKGKIIVLTLIAILMVVAIDFVVGYRRRRRAGICGSCAGVPEDGIGLAGDAGGVLLRH